jgi:membrane-bound serine protease (ClpP class)
MRSKNRFILRSLGLACLLAALVVFAAQAQREKTRPLVVLARVEGAIMPPTKDFLARSIALAERENASAVLIEMDTPGGRADAMREIVQLFMASRVPIIVYVYPPGSRAASAGAIIGFAAHILAMAPGTTIGAAAPVMAGGAGQAQDIPEDMKSKVVNDMTALMRTVAAKRGRNATWAEEIVTKATASSEVEAVKLKVADIIAKDRADLFRQLEGRVVQTDKGEARLSLVGADVKPTEMTWIEKFLMFLFDPNVAVLLFAIAGYGLITEISNPGSVIPGVFGGICLILALYSMSVLSVNAAGLLLLVLSFVLFAVDIYASSHGVLTVGGVVAFIAGALLLFSDTGTGLRVSLGVVFGLALVTAGFFAFIVSAVVKSRKSAPGSGPEQLIGQKAVARSDVNPTGTVFFDGTLWSAVNAGVDPIMAGDEVTVEGREGLTVKVKRVGPSPAQPIYRSGGSES